jgi:RimJ/RimL family protein N-acetyltransferase
MVVVREAEMRDAFLLLTWRNDPPTQRMSRNGGEVSVPDHLAWLAAVLGDPRRLLLVGEDASGTPVGSVRLDPCSWVCPGGFEVSLTVAPEARGQGYATALLFSAEERAAASLDAHQLWANIRADNLRSISAFESCGYDNDPKPSTFGSWWRRDLTS